MDALSLTVNSVFKEEMENYDNFKHYIGWIQHIAIISIIEIFYIDSCLGTQTITTNLPGFLCFKLCIHYLDSHPHKHIFYPYYYYDISNIIRLAWNGNQVEDCTTQNCLECHQEADHAIIINTRQSLSVIIYSLSGVAVYWKLLIQISVASDSTYGEIRCIQKAVRKTKAIALALHYSV